MPLKMWKSSEAIIEFVDLNMLLFDVGLLESEHVPCRLAVVANSEVAVPPNPYRLRHFFESVGAIAVVGVDV